MAQKSKQEFMQKFLNARKKALNVGGTSSTNKTIKQVTDHKEEIKNEDWLTKQALEEIERTAKIHKVKRESTGLSSDEPKNKTNKRFLATTINHALSHNERKISKNMEKSSHKLQELERYQKLKNSKEKFGDRKHHFKKPEKLKESEDSSD